jgi:hypothetical protein
LFRRGGGRATSRRWWRRGRAEPVLDQPREGGVRFEEAIGASRDEGPAVQAEDASLRRQAAALGLGCGEKGAAARLCGFQLLTR